MIVRLQCPSSFQCFSHNTHHFCEDVGEFYRIFYFQVQFLGIFRYAANEFYLIIPLFLTFIREF